MFFSSILTGLFLDAMPNLILAARLSARQPRVCGFKMARNLGNNPIPGIPVELFDAIFQPSNISTANFANGDGGNIVFTTRNLVIEDGGFITANPFTTGKGGNIDIKAEIIALRGIAATGIGGSIVTTTFGNGDAGNLTIETQDLQISDGGLIAASTSGRGNGGNLTVIADSVR